MAVRARATAAFVDLQGAPVSLDRFAGQPVVLSFLAPADGDSQAQLPLLIRLAGAYQAEGVVFVVAGEEASLAQLREFKQAHELTIPVWQDKGGAELASRGFGSVPAHQFIDRTGHVAANREGFQSRGQLLEQIEAIRK